MTYEVGVSGERAEVAAAGAVERPQDGAGRVALHAVELPGVARVDDDVGVDGADGVDVEPVPGAGGVALAGLQGPGVGGGEGDVRDGAPGPEDGGRGDVDFDGETVVHESVLGAAYAREVRGGVVVYAHEERAPWRDLLFVQVDGAVEGLAGGDLQVELRTDDVTCRVAGVDEGDVAIAVADVGACAVVAIHVRQVGRAVDGLHAEVVGIGRGMRIELRSVPDQVPWVCQISI